MVMSIEHAPGYDSEIDEKVVNEIDSNGELSSSDEDENFEGEAQREECSMNNNATPVETEMEVEDPDDSDEHLLAEFE